MLGMVCAYEESGYYYNADKIMSMPLTVIMGTGTVMLPKMSANKILFFLSKKAIIQQHLIVYLQP